MRGDIIKGYVTMINKIHMVPLLGLMSMVVIAMNSPKSDQGQELPSTPIVRPLRLNEVYSPSDVPSPAQTDMRARGVRRNLIATFTPQINSIIYTVLPRPVIMSPNLNISPDLIVNDWFFNHINDEQGVLLNRIAAGISSRQRILLSSDEYRLFNLFPAWITQKLYPFVEFSDDDVETTEIVPTSESEERSAKRSRKRNPTER